MSRYRPIYKEIWRDLEDLETDDKLLFIYLLTNEAVTESGIYKISPRKISFETAIPLPTVEQRLNNGLFKNIMYDKENGVIFVKNARRYSTGGSPNLIAKSIQADYRTCPTSPLWDTFQKLYPEYPLNSNGCPRVVQPYDSDSDDDSDKESVNKGGLKGGKKSYGGSIAVIFWFPPLQPVLDVARERGKQQRADAEPDNKGYGKVD